MTTAALHAPTVDFPTGLKVPALMAVLSLLFAANATDPANTIGSIASLATSVGSIIGVFIVWQKYQSNERKKQTDEARTLAKVESLTFRVDDLEKLNAKLELQLEKKEQKNEELEWKVDDQAKQLTTLHNLMNNLWAALQKDGIEGATVVWAQYQVEFTRKKDRKSVV